jgi:pentose-5-phosphate-3-epimerase
MARTARTGTRPTTGNPMTRGGRDLVAGVDSSTQSCKVELCRLSNDAVAATGSAPHPPVAPPSSEQVRSDGLAELGLTGPVLVGAGGGDQHATALGLGLRPGDVVYSFGTSSVVMALSTEPIQDPEGHVDGVADMTGGYLPLVSTLNAAKTTDTFTRLLGVKHAEMSTLALAAAPEVIGPILCAYLDGEPTPNRPGASGLLSGITTATPREQLARAAYEGVIFGLYSGQRHLQRVGVELGGRVIAVGGGARSAAYTQLLADITRQPVLFADAPESTARRAAVQAAAVALGEAVVAVRDALPTARIDLHLILLDGAAADDEPIAIDIAGTLTLDTITLTREQIGRHRIRLDRLRSSGVGVYEELRPEHEGPAADDIDGALVMFIPPGTKQAADPGQLDKVPRLAGTLPVAVDGGITHRLAQQCLDRGAEYLISGRDLFRVDATHPDPSVTRERRSA